MPTRDIIVLGASAGGLKALVEVVDAFPRDLRASVLLVLHTSPYFHSDLPKILSGAGKLATKFGEHGERIRHGHIYVAPRDQHLLVRDDQLVLSRAPRENLQRPAVDVLFRSAASAYRRRVVGVVLSGMLGDGSIGLMAIKARGGATIVQDPAEAEYPSMPLRAMQYASVDDVLSARDIGRRLVELASADLPREVATPMATVTDKEADLLQRDFDAQARGARTDQVSVLSCPDCGGVLWQLDEEGLTKFRCHVGHSYLPEMLLVQKSEELEGALWSAVRALVERATVARQVAERARGGGDATRAAEYEAQAQQDVRNIDLIRQQILEATPSSVLPGNK